MAKTESENIFYKITYVCSINTFKDMEDQLFERLSGENIEFEHGSVDEEDLGTKTFTFDITKKDRDRCQEECCGCHLE